MSVYNFNFQNAAAANGNGTIANVGGLAGIGVSVVGAAGVNTVNFEATLDDTNWYAIEVYNLQTGSIVQTTTADGLYYLAIAGFDQVRCRISGYTSGSVTIIGKGIVSVAPMNVEGAFAVQRQTAGSAAPNQTIKTFSSSGGVSINTGGTTTVYTVTAGKTFYITDIFIATDNATPALTQVKAGATVVAESYLSTTQAINMLAIESQPAVAGGVAITITWPTATGKNGSYFIAGFEQ